MLLVGATSSLVLVAFLIPLAVLVRSAAADRALSSVVVEVQAFAPTVATTEDVATLRQAVAAANTDNPHPLTIYLPDSTVVGPAVPPSAAVAQAARGQSFTTAVPGGQEVVIAVAGLPGGTAGPTTVESGR